MKSEIGLRSRWLFPVGALVSVLILAGCPAPTGNDSGGGGGGGQSDAELAEQLVDEGLGFITNSSNRDWDQAFSSFAQAYDANPDNPDAALWYAMLNLADIATNTDTQAFLSDFIGLETYPEALNELLDPSQNTSWLSQTIVPDPDVLADTVSVPLVAIPPAIQTYDSSDGGTAAIITTQEYVLGLANAVVNNNLTGFNGARNALVDLLQNRLTEVITVLDAVPVSAGIAITYQMYYASQTEALDSGWPQTTSGAPVEVVIGAAEAKVLASALYTLQSVLFRTRALDVTFPVQAFWNVLNPVSTDASAGDFSALPNPLNEGFLSATPGALAFLADGRDAADSALSLSQQALNSILADRNGFAISSSSPISGVADSWSSTTTALTFQVIAATRLLNSVRNGTDVFFPTDFGDHASADAFFEFYSVEGNWPTNVELVDGQPSAAPVNLQAMYAVPLLAIDSILELEADGDPALYEFTTSFDAASGYSTSYVGGSKVSAVANPVGTPGNDTVYAIRFPDITFGGAIPMDAGAVEDLRQQISRTQFAGLNDDGSQATDIVVASGGTVSVFMPIVPPHVAYGSFNSGADITLTDTEYDYWLPGASQTFTPRGSLFQTIAQQSDPTEFESWQDLIGDGSLSYAGGDEVVIDGIDVASEGGSNQPPREFVYFINHSETTDDREVQLTINSLSGGVPQEGGVRLQIHEVPTGTYTSDWRNEGIVESIYVDFSLLTSPPYSQPLLDSADFNGNDFILMIINNLDDENDLDPDTREGNPISANVDVRIF